MSDLPSMPPSRGQLFLDWWGEHLRRNPIDAWFSRRRRDPRRVARASVVRDRYWSAGAADSEGRPLANAPASGEVVLLLDESNGSRRRVTLPLAVHRNVRQVLSHDLDRLTPLRASELYFDARVVSRDWRAGTCVAELVAAPRARVRPQIEALEARGLTVTRIVLAAEDLASDIDLMPAERRAKSESGRGGWLLPLLAALCLLLLLATAAFPVWQARERVIALQALEAKSRSEAEQASVLQRQVEKQLSEYNFLLQRKHTTPLVVQLLDDLSKRLPDDTWVQSLEIKTNPQTKVREVVLQGETGSGARLVQILQESPLLKEPALKAAMTRLAPNAERFHLGAELVLAELPEKIRPTEATAALTVPLAPTPAAGAPAAGAGVSAPAAARSAETKAEPKSEPKAEAKAESKSAETKAETKPTPARPSGDSKSEPKAEPKAADRAAGAGAPPAREPPATGGRP